MTNVSRRKAALPPLALVTPNDGVGVAMRAIEDISTVIRLKRGDRLDLGRDRAKLIYVVRSGHLVLEASLSATSHVSVALYAPGSILRCSDLPALLSMSAIATAPCQILRAGEPAFERLNEQSPDVRAYCMQELALQCARDKAHIILLSGFSGEARVASFFVEMAHRLGRRNGSIVSVEIPFSRSDIANFLALNPDTLSRIFSRLKTLGLVKSSGRRSVEILELAELTKLTPGDLGLLDGERNLASVPAGVTSS